MSTGKVVQVIGAVIDVEFPRDAIPAIYDALKIDGTELTLEVQQQLGDGVVRTIALGSTDGLTRGLDVRATGKPISVPVGKGTPTGGGGRWIAGRSSNVHWQGCGGHRRRHRRGMPA